MDMDKLVLTKYSKSDMRQNVFNLLKVSAHGIFYFDWNATSYVTVTWQLVNSMT